VKNETYGYGGFGAEELGDKLVFLWVKNRKFLGCVTCEIWSSILGAVTPTPLSFSKSQLVIIVKLLRLVYKGVGNLILTAFVCMLNVF
jgi:hypothetical protein